MSMEQLARAMFADPVQTLCRLRGTDEYEQALRALPIKSIEPLEPSLTLIEQEASALLAEVKKIKRESKQALKKQTTAAKLGAFNG